MTTNRDMNTLGRVLSHLAIAMALLMFLCLVFFYWVLPLITNQDKVVKVPDVHSMSINDAIKFLDRLHLGYVVVDSGYNAEVPPGTVLDQYPRPAQIVKVDRRIQLTLNATNPPMVKYPDLSGSTFDFAQKQLRILGLKIGTIEYRPDIAQNSILESRSHGKRILPGDTIPKGSNVDFILGSSTDNFALPDLTDMRIDEVQMFLLGMGLKLNAVHPASDNVRKSDIVVRQQPVAGDTVRHGDKVEVWVVE